MADGSLDKKGRLKLSLAIKDKKHLEKFAKLIEVPIHTYLAKCNGKQCQVNIRII
jgi:hypothetical protein